MGTGCLEFKLPAGSLLGGVGKPPPPPTGQKAQLSFFSQPLYGVDLSRSGDLRFWLNLCFHRWMCLVFLRGQTTLDFDKCSFFVLLLRLFRSCHKISDFAMVFGTVGAGHSCPPYLGTLIQHDRGRKCTSDVTCDICKDWSVVQWEVFLKKRS